MNKNGSVVIGCMIVFIVLFLSALVGGFCWAYSINTVLTWFGRAAIVKFWQGALIGLVPGLGQASLPVAVVIWVISLFI